MPRVLTLIALVACSPPPATTRQVENRGGVDVPLELQLVSPSRYDHEVQSPCPVSGTPISGMEARVRAAFVRRGLVAEPVRVWTIPPRTPDLPLVPDDLRDDPTADVIGLDLRSGAGTLLVRHPKGNRMFEATLYCATMARDALFLDHARSWIINE